ncbi:FHA domain-containing protein [Myxococcus sp. MISCRS1]|jgi:class 3 adenylate cyclase|uniref:FHA domain-containing protein n=1 Tax=Myxococcus TaxID=32 RepID=UPI001CBE6BD2|nr:MULTISPECIES: FHA domain-containing protein [unclassified Myxococcus]MBZ4396216.1 FHA domain-containing protein [Myxococcus sp. AS-1-15]MBZ4408673.1 FHA domain-containing protein [Myxococcus sp. XM-1-1-1]MCY1000730.1 FHA domain-containing protein [Myxococcus sp. MISCRS1]BDT37723.1 FHA domain-containing protein [Myxococcus sp. MH1]
MWQIIINGPGYFDTSYDLPEGVTSLGRADENDIVLGGDLVSRRHARLYVEADILRIEDLGSRNGSRVNGAPLQGSRQLSPGDSVALGENTLAVRQPNTVENAATEMVDLGAGGVVRFGHGQDVGPSVLLAKSVRDADVLRLLDNVGPVPFEDFNQQASFVPPASPRVAQETLVLMFRTAEALSTATTLSTFLDLTMDRLLERTDATTAVVLLKHPTGALVPAAVRHRGRLAKGEVPVSDAIVDEALRQGRALAVGDVRDDRRFAARESVILYGVASVLCIPIGSEAPYQGVLYVNTSAKGDGLEPMLDACSAVAHLVATGVQKFSPRDGGATQERLRRSLERFHPPDVAERRATEAQRQGGRLPGLEERTLTVLHVELVGFPALASRIGGAKATSLLSDFHSRATGIVFSFEATVESFIGESMRALFGVPYVKGEDSVRAVRAALALRSDWERAMSRRPLDERCSLRMALHTTRALVGMIGNEVRPDYTAVGEGMSVATWLAATGNPGQVLISGKVLAAVAARFDVMPLGERLVRPPKEKVAAFEVLDEDVGVLTNPGLR